MTDLRSSLLVTLALGAGCAAGGPIALRWGEEGCRHCHMTLEDKRYGAEVVTVTGKVYAFDDAGCAALFLAEGGVAAPEVGEVWVVDATRPATLVPALQARFIRSAEISTPMGSGILATADQAQADSIATATHGESLGWPELVALAQHGQLEHR